MSVPLPRQVQLSPANAAPADAARPAVRTRGKIVADNRMIRSFAGQNTTGCGDGKGGPLQAA
jgi:hypothetical protein